MSAARLNWGLILIILGLALLGWTSGRLPFEFIIKLVLLWPVLLIAFGIQMIFSRSKIAALSYLSTLLILAAAIYALSPFWGDLSEGRKYERTSGRLSEILEGSPKLLEISADFNNREFTLVDGDRQKAELRYDHELITPEFSAHRQDGSMSLRLRDRGWHWAKLFGDDNLPLWKLSLPPDLPIDVRLSVNRCYCYLRMAGLQINTLELEGKSCHEAVLQFGKSLPPQPVKIDLRDSKMRLEIPSGIPVKIVGGADLPRYLISDLGLVKWGEDLVSDTTFLSGAILMLDFKSEPEQLILNRY